jgi:hypothetical protein
VRRRIRRALRRLLPFYASACTGGEPLSVSDALLPLWSEEFEGPTGRIRAHDPAWIQIFGQVNVDSTAGAAVADPGTEDGDDDYVYRSQAASDLLIVGEVYWDIVDGIGIELICPPGTVHESLYELGLYQDRLQIFRYDGGGNPAVYEILDYSDPLGLTSGEYTLAFRARHDGSRWRLMGEVRAAGSNTVIATVGPENDDTHGPSIGQGIGFYNNSEEASRVYSLRVAGR